MCPAWEPRARPFPWQSNSLPQKLRTPITPGGAGLGPFSNLPFPNTCAAIFFGGMDMSLRGEVWPFLREALRAQKHQEDVAIQQGR